VLLSGRGKEQRYVYRAIDEHDQVLDVLFRDHRDTASAEAFFRRTLTTSGVTPTPIVSDHHQPSIQAVREVFPEATHVRTGLHRAAPGCTGHGARPPRASSAATSPPAPASARPAA
jgi:transposase-like protein